MLREELYRLAMEQGLAGDAAFVAIGATDVAALDDREYREAQLAAGIVEGRLHLLAYALGASASGMTFIDSEVPATIGEPLDGLAPHLCGRAGIPIGFRGVARRADRGARGDTADPGPGSHIGIRWRLICSVAG